MWKWWYSYLIGIIIGIITIILNLSPIWFAIVILFSSLIGTNFDGVKTDVRVDQLEERIERLEKR